ncbi:MAG: acetylxylan esterase [Gemmataceae bacterium]|nr:acetylxylan esterase [Gemmataceae bacterium]
MSTRRQFLATSAALALGSTAASAATDPTRILTDSEDSKDARLNPMKTLNDYFPFQVPATLAEWEARKKVVREQIQVALGLWPMPIPTPLNPVIHSPIERDGYTVEKVQFASMPGHYVTGNLYRPTGKTDGPRPAILSPHGHWNNGRFHTANDKEIQAQLDSKAEKTREGAKHPLQARCAGLAKLGFVVFHYDMVGYADSTALEHRTGFADVDAELRAHNMMGLQTWNSIRALDFLESLPGVDRKRIGVTGASGGGTQTFILCALDDRPACAFPAVMVSAQMQGGCTCENCSGLRVNTGNVEIAAIFAPKPLAMSCADDWTKKFLQDGYGLPELKKLYGLYGKAENVEAKAWLQYGHNYNLHAREYMYAFFAKQLLGKDGPVEEPAYVPVPPKDLAVFDEQHPRPADEKKIAELRLALRDRDGEWIKSLRSGKDAKAVESFRAVVGPALRAMVNSELPKEIAVRTGPIQTKHDGFIMHRAILGRTNEADAVPCAGVFDPKTVGPRLVVWAHPAGKSSLLVDGKLAPAVKSLTDAGYAVVAPDVLRIGENNTSKTPYKVDAGFAGYTFGYNRTLLANRVHDLLTVIAFGKTITKAQTIHLVGWGEAGPWAVLAKAIAGDAVTKTAADLNKFTFSAIKSTSDPMLLPGAVKYGGILSFQALCAPGALLAHNEASADEFLPVAYAAAPGKLTRSADKWSEEKVVEWLVAKS